MVVTKDSKRLQVDRSESSQCTRNLVGNAPVYFLRSKTFTSIDKSLTANMRAPGRFHTETGRLFRVISFITKTRLYNFDPLKPHFYIVKLGFTGVYIIFLISAQHSRTDSTRRF